MNPESGPDFLKDKYWSKAEFRDAVEKSAEKKRRAEEEISISQKPQENIPYYLERLEKVTQREDPKTHERGRLFLEKAIYSKYIIKPENISADYMKNIVLGNFAEQHGYDLADLRNEEIKQEILNQFQKETNQNFSDYLIPEDEQENVRKMITHDQKARIDNWFDYLTSPEAQHAPAAFRYWAFAEMLKLGGYDENRHAFNKRTETTAATFPELDQQALALVFDEIQRKRTNEPSAVVANNEVRQAEFKKLLESEDFGKLYAFSLEHVNSLRLPSERLIISKGVWRQFPKGTPAKELTSTLQGFNTKWCIAGEGYAQNYLTHSDLWVYYSEDADGENSIPRACIVDSKEHGITEVRGIISDQESKQHLDDYITPVVEDKLKEMPGGEKWQTTMSDMRHLARIHLKHLQQIPLDKADLIFIYEINHQIQGSGYNRDPRIEELRRGRNPKEDAPIVLGCAPNEIAWSQNEINEETRAYIGPLFPGIFDKLKNVEEIYTAFPEARIRKSELTIGGKTKVELEKEMRGKKINISERSQDMLKSPDFTTLANPEEISLVRLKVEDLGFTSFATTEQIYARAQELGLELCPAEVAPHQRLKDMDQPLDDWYWIAMKPISGRGGYPDVFHVVHDSDGLWLDSRWASPTNKWFPGYEFLFRFR
jgi:hypothetical protein